jgi:hypothetical protein
LTTWTLSCASSSIALPPVLENRSLRISPDIPGFEYQYEECIAHFLGFCTKTEMKKDVYDLTDIEVRKKLIAMGFILKVRDK